MVPDKNSIGSKRFFTLFVLSLLFAFAFMTGCQGNKPAAKQDNSAGQASPDPTPEPEAVYSLPDGVSLSSESDRNIKTNASVPEMKETALAEQTEFYCQFYPDSKPVKTFEGSFAKFNGVKNKVKTVILESKDSMENVTEFYLTQFSNPVMVVDGETVFIMPGAEIVLGNGKIETIAIQPLKDKGITEITIFSSDMEI